jgi:hypothetical protein
LIEHHRDIDIAVGLMVAARAAAEQVETVEAVTKAASQALLQILEEARTFGSSIMVQT